MRFFIVPFCLLALHPAVACEVGNQIDVSVGKVDFSAATGREAIFSTCTLNLTDSTTSAQVSHYLKGARLSDYHSFPSPELARFTDAVLRDIVSQPMTAGAVVDSTIFLPALSDAADYWSKRIAVPSVSGEAKVHPRPLKITLRNGSGDPGKRFFGDLLDFDGEKATLRDGQAAQQLVHWAMQRCGTYYLESR